MDKRHFLLALAATLALPASADDLERERRHFPSNVKRGKMTLGYGRDIVIDGKPRQLSPAARIFSAENRSVTPSSVRDQDIIVNYTDDLHGYINRVWILTPEEARQHPPGSR